MTQTAAPVKLLVIDDEAPALRAYQQLLSSRGFHVEVCSESARVLSLLTHADGYHAVLLDIRMPGLDGTDLLPLIKRRRPELPVILVSAYCDDAHAEYYQRLGASAAIGKPFSTEVLLETIDRVLTRQDAIPITLTSLSLREARIQVARKLILVALAKTNWNQVKSAELLGVSRYCLMRWMKKLGLAAH